MYEKELELVIEKYLDEVPLAQIAKEVGISLSTVKRLLQANRRQRKIPHRRGSTRFRKDRAENTTESSSWNVRLGLQYITTQWVRL